MTASQSLASRSESPVVAISKYGRSCWPIVLVVATLSFAQAKAGDILRYLPEDALGFVVVQDLSDLSFKAERFTQLFELSLPAPLAFAKLSTGLGEGIDEDGDLLVALLAGPREAPAPQPMVLLPVTDYAKFASSVHADESGKISRVTIVGEDVLIAKMGSFALLMDVEHRETLELILGLEPEPVAALKPLESWIAQNDCVAALMPAGLEALLQLGRQAIEQQQDRFAEQFEGQEASALLKQLEMNLAVSKWLLETLGGEVSMGAFGVSLDEDINLRLGKRILLKESSALAKSGPAVSSKTSPLEGFANQPFVVAGGGPIPPGWTDVLASASKKFMEKMPELYGLENLDEAQWNQLEESYRGMMQGLETSSLIMLPGKEGEPLFSNIYGIAKTTDSSAYLKSYQEAVKIWNEIMAESTSDIPLDYEVTPKKVAGAEACEIVVDVATAAQAPNVPMFNWMLEAMFGEDGKMRQLLVAADKHTLVYGMSDEEQLMPVLESAKNADSGLINAAEVQATMRLVPAEAAWKLLISPQGCVQWGGRIANEFLVHLQGQTIEIPEFAASSPVGVSMHLNDGRFEFDMVCPVDMLQALADFIEKCKEL